jgi:beta-glucosidase
MATRAVFRTLAACLCLIAAALATTLRARQGRAGAEQPPVAARAKPLLTIDGLRFKDANGSGQLDPYEDWRLGVDERVRDLVARMTLDEKAGLMLIDTLNPAAGGATSPQAEDYLRVQQMRRFIFRSVVTATPAEAASGGRGGFGGAQVTPAQAATWTNAIQELAEGTRLGIPVLCKSNARNHYERSARLGINTEAGSLSEWPKEAGLAATRDMALVADFARTMGQEWQAIGLRGMYGYMADLATEPRWYRVHECFTENADLAADIMKTLVTNLQGGPVSPRTAVALTVKHFPGGGPQQLGLDPHFTFGKNQVYPSGQFANHLKPFIAAIDAGVSAVMPYYGVPVDLTYGGMKLDPLGMAFSKQIVTDLLRGRLGFKGYVNSDTGIVTDRAWGLEKASVAERVAAAINSGTDVLSGFHDRQTIIEAVRTGLVTEARVNEAAARLLTEQFRLGLFENPYVDASKADAIVGNAQFRARAMDAQRASIVLLQNAATGGTGVLPLRAPSPSRPITLYTMGLNTRVVSGADYGGYTVVPGDYDAAKGERRPGATGADYALIRVEVTNPRAVTSTYGSANPATGANPAFVNPVTGKAWGADDTKGLDNGLTFGGSFPWEAGNLSFTAMAASQSWNVSPSLADIQAVMKQAGASRTVLCIYFRQPYVLDDESGLRRAGAILAGFGVSDAALMDVLTGRFSPRGKLPFALARTLQAVRDNAPDAPGYPAADTLFPFGHGLTYATRR